jgi:hypothetical protein
MNKRLQACHLRYNDEIGNYTVSGCIGAKTGLKCLGRKTTASFRSSVHIYSYELGGIDNL